MSFRVLDGVITFGIQGIDASVDGSILVMTPTTTSGSTAVIWTWSGSVPNPYIPKK